MKFFFRGSFSRRLASVAMTTLAFAIAAPAQEASQPSAIDLSKKETAASALLRTMASQEYEVRSAAEAMPEELYSYRPAEGKRKGAGRDLAHAAAAIMNGVAVTGDGAPLELESDERAARPFLFHRQ